jgi:hypothetical protein
MEKVAIYQNDATNGYIAMEYDGICSIVQTGNEFLPDRGDMKDMITYYKKSRSSLLLPNEQLVTINVLLPRAQTKKLHDSCLQWIIN